MDEHVTRTRPQFYLGTIVEWGGYFNFLVQLRAKVSHASNMHDEQWVDGEQCVDHDGCNTLAGRIPLMLRITVKRGWRVDYHV